MSLRSELVMAICDRLVRITARFAALVLRAQEGRFRPARRRGVRPVPAEAVPDGPVGVKLPHGFAWLLPLVPDAASYGGQFAHLLADPEIAALLAMSPSFGRVPRPMCRMLGVSPLPDALKRLPLKPRTVRARKAVISEPPMRPIYPKTRVVGGIEVYARRSLGGFSSA